MEPKHPEARLNVTLGFFVGDDLIKVRRALKRAHLTIKPADFMLALTRLVTLSKGVYQEDSFSKWFDGVLEEYGPPTPVDDPKQLEVYAMDFYDVFASVASKMRPWLNALEPVERPPWQSIAYDLRLKKGWVYVTTDSTDTV